MQYVVPDFEIIFPDIAAKVVFINIRVGEIDQFISVFFDKAVFAHFINGDHIFLIHICHMDKRIRTGIFKLFDKFTGRLQGFCFMINKIPGPAVQFALRICPNKSQVTFDPVVGTGYFKDVFFRFRAKGCRRIIFQELPVAFQLFVFCFGFIQQFFIVFTGLVCFPGIGISIYKIEEGLVCVGFNRLVVGNFIA